MGIYLFLNTFKENKWKNLTINKLNETVKQQINMIKNIMCAIYKKLLRS